jgi:hypothetical protein
MTKRLYFLHIPKVGGMNISSSIISNQNISFFDSSNTKTLEDFYSSQYVYGHMGRTPIKKDPTISVACLFRDPLARFVSNFIHTYNYISDKIAENEEYVKIEKIEDKLRYYLFEDLHFSTVTNFQSRSIFNTMKDDAFENMFKKLDDPEYKTIDKTNNLWRLSDEEFSFEDIKKLVDSFEIVGTTEDHDGFFEKISKWFLDNYNETISANPNILSFLIDEQSNKHTTYSLLNLLSEEEKERFRNIHEIDFKLYDYIKTKNV